MRYLTITGLVTLGLLGTSLYYVNQPTINQDDFMQIEGDSSLFEGVTLNGRYDNNIFYSNSETTWLESELSHLESLDSLHNPSLTQLQKSYPDFVSDVYYNNQTGTTMANFVESNDYLTAAYFSASNASNSLNYTPLTYDTIHFSVLNKQTDELTDYALDRQAMSGAHYVDILGLYQNGSQINVLFTESNNSESELRMMSYDMENQALKEDLLESTVGSYTFVQHRTMNNPISANTQHALITGNAQTQLVDFEQNNLTILPEEDHMYFLSNTDKLYSLSPDYQWISYDMDTMEATQKVALDLTDIFGEASPNFDNIFYQDLPPTIDVVNDKVFVVKAQANTNVSDYMIFDANSSETLASGTLSFENSNTNDPINAVIVSITANQ